MSRITLAFSCFFRLLFGARLSARAADYLPEEARPALPEPKPDKKDKKGKDDESAKPGKEAAGKKEAAESKPRSKPANLADHHRDGALALLGLMQREGRLIDFLQESLDDYEDEDIGASVRDIHRGCKKVLSEHLELEAVMPGEEDDDVTVPKGFDPGEIRLIGDVSGDPPFKGVLRHHGWRATKAKLPTLSEGVDRTILAPAEVELS